MNARIIFALAVTVAGLLNSVVTLASSGSVNISGRVLDDSCLVTLAGGPGGASSLALPDMPLTSLSRAGATAGITPMTMALSDCPTQASVRAWFEPLGMDSNTGNLTNMAANTPAANVQVQITDGSGRNIIDPRINSNNIYSSLDEETITLSYAAQYVAVGGAVSAGNVESHLVYTLEYL